MWNYDPSTTSTPKTREQLLELIDQNNRVTREELAQILEISINGVKQHILKLKKDGLLARVGGHRFGVWQVTR
jgi:predicted HTH transcriptional regulator